jgi:hypothetical protein
MRFLAIVLFFLFSTLLVSSAQNNKKSVTAYTDDFSGLHYDFGVGKYDNLYLLQTGFPMIQSFRVPAGMKVLLYPQDNFQGTPLEITEDAYKRYLMGKGFGQPGQSISIVVAENTAPPNPKMITIYLDNFSGASKNLSAGYYESYEFGAIGNDQISSVKVPKGMKVTLYQQSGYAGKSLVLSQDAPASFLIANNFNDAASSLRVEVYEPEAPKTKPDKIEKHAPVIVVEQEKKEDPKPEALTEADPKCRFFQGDFSGSFQTVSPGRYDVKQLIIGDNELSSIQMADGLKVTLYELEGFKGKSVVLTHDTDAASLEAMQFNNVASSMVVEIIPRITLFQDNFSGDAFSFARGFYDLNSMKLDNDQVSSVKVMPGLWVLLFEDINYGGRSLLLTEDASTQYLSKFKFNDQASSMIVGSVDDPLPQATVYADDFYGSSQTLTVGQYTFMEMGIGNNTLSSIQIPSGIHITLFDGDDFDGRSIKLFKSAGTDLLKKFGFNDVTSSMLVGLARVEDQLVTIYSGSFDGAKQSLSAGKYRASDITIGLKELSSIKIPNGFRVTLYEKNYLDGSFMMLDHDMDFSRISQLDNYYASIVVEGGLEPVITEVAMPAPLEEKPFAPTEKKPEPVLVTTPPCTLSDETFERALKVINNRPFNDERLAMVKLVTKEKCLTNQQIRTIAKVFSFDDYTLEFVKYAYDLASEKDTYYELEDVFQFSSVRESFMKFLSEK